MICSADNGVTGTDGASIVVVRVIAWTYFSRMAANSADTVSLVCVLEGKKLRVRITSVGYLSTANCQFPRALRVEGRRYTVNAAEVRLITGTRRNFYRVNARSVDIVSATIDKVYEDCDCADCAVCLFEPKDTVFAPCGHYYCCSGCAAALTKCPICRGAIVARIARSNVA